VVHKLPLVCAVALVASTACDTEDLGALTPRIAISACDGGAVEMGGVIVGGVSDCAVEFGAVQLTAPRSYGLLIVNPSNVTLRITGTELLAGADPAFEIDAAPDEIAPGQRVPVTIRFRPQLQSEVRATVRITSDGDNVAGGAIDIALVGLGVGEGAPPVVVGPPGDGPRCDVRISAVNGQSTSGTPALEPLDDINLLVESSDPSASTSWEFVVRPPGSALAFVTPLGDSTGLIFDGSKYGIDAAGDYRVRAVQTDAAGQVGTCELSFSAVPTDELLIQLTWTTAFGDVDLHLIKQGDQDRYCARSVEAGPLAEDCGAGVIEDCYFWSCKPANSLRPDWDDDGAVGTGGDPSLDVDDRCGFGPEHINVDFPTSGRHLLGIDHFGHNGCPGAGPSDVTVRVYTYGQLTAEWFRTLEEGDWWEVAIIDWPADTGAVCIDDLAVDGDECP